MSINFPEIQSMIRNKIGKRRRNQEKDENDSHLTNEKNENDGTEEMDNKDHISKFLEKNNDEAQKNITNNTNHNNMGNSKEKNETTDSTKTKAVLLEIAQKSGANKTTNNKKTNKNKINENLQIKPHPNINPIIVEKSIKKLPPSDNPEQERPHFEEDTFFDHFKNEKLDSIKNVQNLKNAKYLDSGQISKNLDTFTTFDGSKNMIHMDPNLSNPNLLDLDPSRRKLGDALKKLHSFRKRNLPIGKNRAETKEFFLMNDFEKKIDDFKKIQDEKYGTFNYSLESSTLPEEQIDRRSILGILNPSKYKEIGVVTERLVASKFNKKFYLKR